jgi:hypothetical protein
VLPLYIWVQALAAAAEGEEGEQEGEGAEEQLVMACLELKPLNRDRP